MWVRGAEKRKLKKKIVSLVWHFLYWAEKYLHLTVVRVIASASVWEWTIYEQCSGHLTANRNAGNKEGSICFHN